MRRLELGLQWSFRGKAGEADEIRARVGNGRSVWRRKLESLVRTCRQSCKKLAEEAAKVGRLKQLNKAPRMIFANGCLRGSQLSCQLTVYGIQ